MKRFILTTSVFAVSLGAQDSSVTRATSVDINGRRVADGPTYATAKSGSDTSTTERVQSVNGRTVPVEQIQERVLRNDASGKVIERIIRRYSPTGEPAQPIRETVEEQKRADGSSSIQTTTYSGDVNGHMQLVSKSTTETHVSGSTQTVDTVVQQPTLNGSLDTVEKRNTVTVKDASGNFRSDATTYRRDGNGGFTAAVRETIEHTKQGSEANDQTAEYELGPDGRLQLHSQTVAHTVTRSDGSKETERNVFGANVPGTVDPTGRLKLQEQQLVQTRNNPDGSVVESFSVRRPTVADPHTLGPAQQVSETVCRGKCGDDKDKP